MARKRRFDAVGRGAATRGSAGAPRSPHSPGRPIPLRRRGAGSAQADRICPANGSTLPIGQDNRAPDPGRGQPGHGSDPRLGPRQSWPDPSGALRPRAVAGRAARGRQGSQERVDEVVVAADVAQRAFSGVGQRLTGLLLLRLPAGLKPGQA
jgi:hypothetical protein